MSSLARLSRGYRRLNFGGMVTMATGLPQGSESSSMRFASSNTFGAADQSTFQAVKTLAFQLQEPRPLRATHTVRDATTAPSSTSSSESGDCKRRRSELAAALCEGYPRLPPLTLPFSDSCERGKILTFLASECSPTDDTVMRALESFQKTTDGQPNIASRLHCATLSKLRRAATPPYEDVLEFILKQNSIDGMGLLVSLRVDLLQLLRWMKSNGNDDERLPYLKEIDSYLLRLFSIWFSPGMLVLKRITYEDTAASVIELIARKEAVHPMKSLTDLRSRLGPGRRVFSLFHPFLPGKPLAFVHAALENEIPSAMSQVMQQVSAKEHPKVATFYSITNAAPGLAGIGLGAFLIKESIKRLRSEFPSLDTFVTLSPLPNFRHWLEDKIHQNEDHGKFYDGSLLSDDDLRQLQQPSGGALGTTTTNNNGDDDDPWKALQTVLENYHLENEKNHSSSNHQEEEDSSKHNSIRPILMKLASRYLVLEKHRGKPLDGVARFHVGNGAEVHRVNFGADPSRKGMQNSFGMMVNYRYDMEQVEANIKGFEMDYYRTPASPDVRKWLPVVTTDDTSSKPRSKL